MENPKLFRPAKELLSKTMHGDLLPYKVRVCFSMNSLFLLLLISSFCKQCRQAKISYTGSLKADVYFQWDGGAPIAQEFDFGQFPIMLKVGSVFLWFGFLGL